MTKIKNTFEHLLTMTQDALIKSLPEYLSDRSYSVIATDYYILGVSPSEDIQPCLVAHLDTINTHREAGSYNYATKQWETGQKATPKVDDLMISDRYITLSPEANPKLACLGADDRCGVKTILDVIEAGKRPHMLFTTDEEIGCVGSNRIITEGDLPTLADSSMLIQIDRGVHEGFWNEMVFYEYDENSIPEILTELEKYYTLAEGSYTDVAVLGPEYDKPIVNLSAAYENEHTRNEFINLEAYKKNTEGLLSFLTWLEGQDTADWKYTEKAPVWSSYGATAGTWQGSDYANYDDNTYREFVKEDLMCIYSGDTDEAMDIIENCKGFKSWLAVSNKSYALYKDGTVLDSLKQLVTELGMEYKPA